MTTPMTRSQNFSVVGVDTKRVSSVARNDRPSVGASCGNCEYTPMICGRAVASRRSNDPRPVSVVERFSNLPAAPSVSAWKTTRHPGEFSAALRGALSNTMFRCVNCNESRVARMKKPTLLASAPFHGTVETITPPEAGRLLASEHGTDTSIETGENETLGAATLPTEFCCGQVSSVLV
ncbi:Uncharacterised protein [Mycobacteroides abscessus subsp. abscessus]|nr:Uncharacterised protein [Mycobacteroides abscessus subsp. abscessus]